MKTGFTKEVYQQTLEEQDYLCAACGCDLRYCFPPASVHHKKPRSVLRAAEIEKYGPGGGRRNAVGLCGKCHDELHNGKPGYEEFIIHRWEDL